MDPRERFHDPEEMMRVAMDNQAAQIWTAMPGIVASVNLAASTITVSPAIQGVKRKPDGTHEAVTLPVIPDVPIVMPHGGGYTLSFPVKPGDECLLVFSARNIDGWWSQGGVSPPLDARMHDLSDAFAMIGPFSQAKKLAGLSATAVQLRSDDGTMALELDAAENVLRITSPASVLIDAPLVQLTGQLLVDGAVTAGVGGASAVTLQGHRHLDVQAGAAQSGIPVVGT